MGRDRKEDPDAVRFLRAAFVRAQAPVTFKGWHRVINERATPGALFMFRLSRRRKQKLPTKRRRIGRASIRPRVLARHFAGRGNAPSERNPQFECLSTIVHQA